MDLEHLGGIDTVAEERKEEPEKCSKVLGIVLSRAFKLVFNNGNPFSDSFLNGP